MTVIITVLPPSAASGVYVNWKGDTVDETGSTEPAPFSVIATLVALPPKVFPVMVTGVVPHVLPVVALSARVGGLTHPQVTVNIVPVVVQPEAFLTDKKWLLLVTGSKTAEV